MKRLLTFFLLMAFSMPAFGADSKLENLTAQTTKPAANVLFYMTSTANSNASRKVAYSVVRPEMHVNVMDYGAVGDATANDTDAIQAAIDATPSKGTVFFPAKTFKITAPLTRAEAQGPIRILGSGTSYGGSVIKQVTANTTAISITVPEVNYLIDPAIQDNASMIEHMRIEGPTGNTSGDAIYIVSSIQLNYVSTYNFYNGLRTGTDSLDNSSYVDIENSKFTSAVNAGIYSIKPYNHNMAIRTTRLDSNGYGIFLRSSTGDVERFSITDSEIERNVTAGIYLDGVRAIYIGANYFETPNSNGSDINLGANYANTDVTIQSNWFTNHPSASNVDHVKMNQVTGVKISGNTFNGASGSGVDIRGSASTSGVVLENNGTPTTSGLTNAKYSVDRSANVLIGGTLGVTGATTLTGNVGIGTTSPASKLEVNGAVKIGAYTLPSTDGSSNQILKTNGSGAVTWQADTGGGTATAVTLTDSSSCTWDLAVSTGGTLSATNQTCPGNNFTFYDTNNFIFVDGNNFKFAA
jgi:hypothetical protein